MRFERFKSGFHTHKFSNETKTQNETICKCGISKIFCPELFQRKDKFHIVLANNAFQQGCYQAITLYHISYIFRKKAK